VVSTDGPADSMWDGFFRLVGANNVKVRDWLVAVQNGRHWDEEHGIGPQCGCCALDKAMDLSCVGGLPEYMLLLWLRAPYFASLPMLGLKALSWREECVKELEA